MHTCGRGLTGGGYSKFPTCMFLAPNYIRCLYLQQGVFSPMEGVWAGYELKAMHFRVESSCYGVETEVTTPISGP